MHDTTEASILALVNDSVAKARLRSTLNKNTDTLRILSRLDRLISHLHNHAVDILILRTKGYDSQRAVYLDLLEEIVLKSPATRIIVLTHSQQASDDVEALSLSAVQAIADDVSESVLLRALERAFRSRPTYAPNLLLKKGDKNDRFGSMIGRSRAMKRVFQQIRKAADTDIPILLLGETGTGKDVAARMIHQLSRRCEEPYLPLNLGSLPTELIASELFGHEKGAFSGATARHKGVFERGTDGTVFLDEIDSVSEKVRVSLLRVIEQKKFTRLGGHQSVKSNARILTASNADLEALMKKGEFRKDLFYRLDVFRIELPPLRERPEDIPVMVNHMVSDFNRALKKQIVRIAPEVIDILSANEWPGNVRELKNVLQRSVLLCNGNELVPEHLPPRFTRDKAESETITFNVGTTLKEVEKEMVIRALRATGNNRKKAAELLGISRRVIYNKLEKHDLK